MCDNCLQQLPNHIKFELWRPMEDDFQSVMKDAHKFLLDKNLIIDSICYPKVVRFEDLY